MSTNNKLNVVVITGTILLPWPSIQHFIWPLSWCLLADICNHTWIPECGEDIIGNNSHYRLFIDECDMMEYNCDNTKDYELVNYTDCFFKEGPCPTAPPCPSNPTCKNHRFHRMGDRYMTINPSPGRRMRGLGYTLPMRMLSGKRRYTPTKRTRRRPTWPKPRPAPRKAKAKATLKPIKTAKNFRKSWTKQNKRKSAMSKPTSLKTVILESKTVIINGRKVIRIVKGAPLKIKEKEDSDFLE